MPTPVVMRITCCVVKGQDQAVCIWLGPEADYQAGKARVHGSNSILLNAVQTRQIADLLVSQAAELEALGGACPRIEGQRSLELESLLGKMS
jgi:hypothetical protein